MVYWVGADAAHFLHQFQAEWMVCVRNDGKQALKLQSQLDYLRQGVNTDDLPYIVFLHWRC